MEIVHWWKFFKTLVGLQHKHFIKYPKPVICHSYRQPHLYLPFEVSEKSLYVMEILFTEANLAIYLFF